MRQHDDNKHAKELSSAYLIERKGREKKTVKPTWKKYANDRNNSNKKKLKESKRGGGKGT